MSRGLTTGVISQYWPEQVFGPELIMNVMIFDVTQIPEEPPVWRVPSFTDYASLQTAASNHTSSPSEENGRYLKHYWQVKTATNCVPSWAHKTSHPRWDGSHYSPQTIVCGTNSMKWNMLGTGYRRYIPTNPSNSTVAETAYRAHLGSIDVIDHGEGDIRVFSIGSDIQSDQFGYYDMWQKEHGLGTRVVRNLTSAESQMPDMSLLDPYEGNNGVIYEVRKYHQRAWTTQALCETHFENGDLIPYTDDPSTWTSYGTSQIAAVSPPSQLPYSGTIPDIVPAYGLLYNWWAMVDERSLVKTDQGWEPPPPPQYEGVLHIPVNEAAVGPVNFNVDWGDGTEDLGVTGSIDHWYETAGFYQIKITGELPGLRFDLTNWNKLQLLDIVQWGNIAWDTLYSAFKGCYQLNVSAPDTPNFSQILNNNPSEALEKTFQGCIALTGGPGLQNWNVSQFTSLKDLFDNSGLNINLGNWIFNPGVNLEGFLDYSGLSSDNYDLSLLGWAQSTQQNNGPFGIQVHAKDVEYSPMGDIHRDLLRLSYGWTFVGDVYKIQLVPPYNFDVNTSVQPGGVLFTWTRVKDMDGFNVYLKPEGGSFSKHNSELLHSLSEDYVISSLPIGNYEAYATSVLDSEESDPSNVISFEMISENFGVISGAGSIEGIGLGVLAYLSNRLEVYVPPENP